MTRIIFAVSATFLFMLPMSNLEANVIYTTDWPKVVSVNKSFEFKDGGNASIDMPIMGIGGESLYLLQCHTFHYNAADFTYSEISIAG